MTADKPKKLIVHCCYHKVGTQWLKNILEGVADEFGWKLQFCKQEQLRSDTNIFMENHSRVDFSTLPPYVGSHLIRDSRDVVISGYFYHLWCREKWCTKRKYWLWGPSYQKTLNSLSRNEGISLEMRRITKSMIRHMSRGVS